MTAARELRFAFTFDDYDAALHLFRDVFGLETLMDLDHQGGKGVILKAPVATIELFDRAHTRYVDEIEVGRPLGETVRIAVRVDDLDSASDEVEDAKAVPIADPVDTPWGDRNRRYRTIDGLQLTLFAEP
ncbi:MAG: VOC family protein [Actinobacteria bacterium]|nr:VOC family protein [Actinomycetota bacterium]